MYLTRIAINPFLAEARKVVDDTHTLHREVLAMFGEYRKDDSGKSTNRAEGSGVPLWRLDAATDSISLMVVSGSKPNTADLSQRVGWGDDGVTVADYAGFLDSISNGETYSFKATLNMTSRSQGKTSAAVTVNDKLVWLANAAKRNMFKVNNIPQMTTVVDTFEKPNGTKVTLDKTTVEGSLTVLDAEVFKKALSAGVGRGRAYGCGLLTLAPAE